MCLAVSAEERGAGTDGGVGVTLALRTNPGLFWERDHAKSTMDVDEKGF